MYLRSLFEANKNIRDPRQQKASCTETSGWAQSDFTEYRLCSRRQRIYWRNGSTLIHTMRLQHQEVRLFYAHWELFFWDAGEMLTFYHQDPNSSAIFRHQFWNVSINQYHSPPVLTNWKLSPSTYSEVEIWIWNGAMLSGKLYMYITGETQITITLTKTRELLLITTFIYCEVKRKSDTFKAASQKIPTLLTPRPTINSQLQIFTSSQI